MQVQIGYVNVDPRTLDKRNNFTASSPTTYNIQINKDCNIKKPSFLMSVGSIPPGKNYCYVPAWNAYYFLSEPVILDGERATVTCELDYLTTYADAIKSLSAYVVRTADDTHKNKNLRDGKNPVQSNVLCYTLQFNASPFRANYSTDMVYLLTVVGGNHTPSPS
jgi:hypothetical protein